jgi:hypothetical protein
MRKLPGPAGTSKEQDGAVTAEDNSEMRDQKVDCFASVSYCSLSYRSCSYCQMQSSPVLLHRLLFLFSAFVLITIAANARKASKLFTTPSVLSHV